MQTIPRTLFNGTTLQLQERLASFQQALEDHKFTKGVPAPREEDFIEHLARTKEPFEVEPERVQPSAEQLKAAQIATKRATALFAIRRADIEAAAAAQRAEEDALLAAALADSAAPQEVKDYKAALDAPATEELRGR